MGTKTLYKIETKSTPEQMSNRENLYRLFRNRPMSDDHLLSNLGLFMRSSALVKLLFLNELYELIRDIPGIIVEFGLWWGQNIAVFENLRAIHEPFNQNRHIIGFDTFSGYTGFSVADKQDEVIKPGGYSVSENYRSYLDDLIDIHEHNNVLGHIRKHKLVEGDVVKTVPQYFNENPSSVIALAYFDVALYEPTKTCMLAIKPYLIPGSVILLDEFGDPTMPGETLAFREILRDMTFEIRKSKYIPDRSILIVQ